MQTIAGNGRKLHGIYQKDGSGIAAEGLRRIAQLYKIKASVRGRLPEKLDHIHRHWDSPQIFLTDGRVEMDTNPVENTIRPITLNRKNALFAPSRDFGLAKTLPGNGS